MTDTPETDDLARGNHVVPTEFAEQLERERNKARAKIITSLEWSEALADLENNLRSELATVTQQRDEARETVESLTTTAFDLLASLEKARDARDKLEEALEQILSYQGRFGEEDPESIATKALQSLANRNKL